MEHVAQNQGRARIDNGQWYPAKLTITQAMLDVTTIGATVPNQAWEMVDPAGHFHAWTVDRKLPSLMTHTEHVCTLVGAGNGRTEHYGAEDDDECGGYTKTTYSCRICGWDVEPDTIQDIAPQFMPGQRSWRIDIHGVLPLGDTGLVSTAGQVSAVFLAEGHGKWFGVARIGNVAMDYPRGYSVMLLGAGELGQKK